MAHRPICTSTPIATGIPGRTRAGCDGAARVGRLPIAFGWLTMRGDAATARWMKPVMSQTGIRRDAVRAMSCELNC
jgi:hypothetical protein